MPSSPSPNRLAGAVAGKTCPICLEAIESQSAAIIPCLHAYCIRCIRKWSDLKRKCPLCNTDFNSLFRKIKIDSPNFTEEVLYPLETAAISIVPRYDDVSSSWRRRRAAGIVRRSAFRRHWRVRAQASVLPRRRSFVLEVPDVVDQRVREWRASIYEQRLQAVPLPSENRPVPQIVGDNVAKALLLRRIEPWIQRELHAVLGDPDPTVIVHVATSLFISQCETGHGNLQGQVGVEDDFLAPLRPFLHEHTEIFWHELRCFAESSFPMQTYDTVVEYKRMD